jgi:nucleoid DNA-binding protein
MLAKHEQQPTQQTQPKKGEPIEIPVPKVSTFRAAIRKVAQPGKPKREKQS